MGASARAVLLIAAGSTGDGQADTVTVAATKGDDSIPVDANGAAAEVSGLAAFVRITHADLALTDQPSVSEPNWSVQRD